MAMDGNIKGVKNYFAESADEVTGICLG